jgi:hypothetical protein
MADAIMFVTFSILPLMLLIVACGHLHGLIPVEIYEEVYPTFSFAPSMEELALDSFECLLRDLDGLGMCLAQLVSHQGEMAVLLDMPEELPSMDIDVEEFSDTVIEGVVEAYPVFVIGDREVQSALIRDGLAYDTVVENLDAELAPTVLLYEEIFKSAALDLTEELDLTHLLYEMNPVYRPKVGSDESTFFGSSLRTDQDIF